MRRLALLLAAALVLPACGDDDPKPRASASPTPSPVLPSGKPTPVIPIGAKPTTLVTTDVIEGTGSTAVPGNTVTVRYLGVHYDGKEFDSLYDPGEHPLTFLLGGEEVLPGWDQGLIGMKVGGRRQLVIPPDLAYGASGRAPLIGPNETLVFVIDLISVDVGIPNNNTFAPQ